MFPVLATGGKTKDQKATRKEEYAFSQQKSM